MYNENRFTSMVYKNRGTEKEPSMVILGKVAGRSLSDVKRKARELAAGQAKGNLIMGVSDAKGGYYNITVRAAKSR